MKKLSNIVSSNTENSFKKFITEKVLSDVEIIKFIRDNNFSKIDVENNLEKFYQYYISKDTLLNIEHKPKLVCSDKEVNIVYQETDEYKQKVENQKISNKIKTEFIPKRVLTYTFDNLSKNSKKAKLAIEIVNSCMSILNKKSTRGAYVYGPTGTGKTYLMGCIYNYFRKSGKEPTILYYPEFIRKIKSKISNNSYDLPYDFYRPDSVKPRTQIELMERNGNMVELSIVSSIVSAISGRVRGDERLYFPREMFAEGTAELFSEDYQEFQALASKLDVYSNQMK